MNTEIVAHPRMTKQFPTHDTPGTRAMDRDPSLPDVAPDRRRTLAEICREHLKARGFLVTVDGAAVVFPVATFSGKRDLRVTVDATAVYTASCEDDVIVRAGSLISKNGDLDAVIDLASAGTVVWHSGDDGAYLFAFSRSFIAFVDQIAAMRDAAVGLLAYAAGLTDGAMELAVRR